MTTLKVTHKDEDGRIVNDTCFVYSSLENPVLKKAELLEILSMRRKNCRGFRDRGGILAALVGKFRNIQTI
jgi:hypothetical protein